MPSVHRKMSSISVRNTLHWYITLTCHKSRLATQHHKAIWRFPRGGYISLSAMRGVTEPRTHNTHTLTSAPRLGHTKLYWVLGPWHRESQALEINLPWERKTITAVWRPAMCWATRYVPLTSLIISIYLAIYLSFCPGAPAEWNFLAQRTRWRQHWASWTPASLPVAVLSPGLLSAGGKPAAVFGSVVLLSAGDKCAVYESPLYAITPVPGKRHFMEQHTQQ